MDHIVINLLRNFRLPGPFLLYSLGIRGFVENVGGHHSRPQRDAKSQEPGENPLPFD